MMMKMTTTMAMMTMLLSILFIVLIPNIYVDFECYCYLKNKNK